MDENLVEENIDLLYARFYSAAKQLSDKNLLEMTGVPPQEGEGISESRIILVLMECEYNDEVGFKHV